MSSHASKLQICQSWYQKMRRLILRRTDKLPGSPESRIRKFTREPICGLKRPVLRSKRLIFSPTFCPTIRMIEGDDRLPFQGI